ncbi:MAG: AbrB/MazE/SpoVT family DNA-binding domain-containing protein [Candidatus Nanopelagicales bacterium]
MGTRTSVKIARSGNSKMLPVPAELARSLDADIGDAFIVEVSGDDIIYHRDRGGAVVSGSGAGRLGMVPAGRALRMTGRSSVPPLDDWDF